MVVALGKLMLRRCLRPASTETDGIFNSAISVVFIEKHFKNRLRFSPETLFFLLPFSLCFVVFLCLNYPANPQSLGN